MSVSRIAEKAGVSIATVSRVLNNSRRVQPEVAEAVRRAAAELGLAAVKPRQRAKSMSFRSSKRAQAIGLITIGQGYQGWLSMPVMGAVVAEVMKIAEEHELAVHVAEMPDPTQICSVVQRKAVDGALVFIPSGLDAAAADPLRRQLPIVRVMGAQFAAANFDHVAPDNVAIGHLAGEYLLSKGWRKLAYLSLAPDWVLSQQRATGFAARAAEAGIIAESFLLGGSPAMTASYGARTHVRESLGELVDALLASRPAGLFVARDEWLVDLYQLLAARGIKPGEDLQIIACDNEHVRLSLLNPRPASIDLNAPEMAVRAVRRLIGRIKHPDESPVRMLVSPRLALPPTPGVDADATARSALGPAAG